MDCVIRAVRDEEWPKVKELRLAALRDPLAPLAFLDTYDDAVARPDSYWQERTSRAAHGIAARQFIAETPDGSWVGSIAVLVEQAGMGDVLGGESTRSGTHLVGVFVRPENRGQGLIEALFQAALAWSWGLGEHIEQARLFVHERNARAQRAYRKLGFVPTGVTVPMKGDPSSDELEMVLMRPVQNP